MKVAYLILAHNNVDQLISLIDKLDCKDNSFVIHFDLSANKEDFKSIQKYAYSKNNVYLSLKRIKCYWGDFSLVEATIECLKTLFYEFSEFDYAVLISGQHYPIKSNFQIKEFLKKSNGKSYMEYFTIPNDIWKSENGGVNRLKFYYFNKYQRKYISIKKITLRSLAYILKICGIKRAPEMFFDQYYGGSQWWCLSKESCKYILETIESKNKMYKFFRNVFIPDEIFFQTLLLNSPLRDTIISNNLNFIDWGHNNGASPLILNENHYKEIVKSPQLWARKFDLEKSRELRKRIDNNLLEKENK